MKPSALELPALQMPDPVPLPELPPLTQDNSKTVTHHHSHHHTYQITQQPGESSDELADRIHRKQMAAQRMRSPLYDGPD